MWGATLCRTQSGRAGRISIHAPRVGSDGTYMSVVAVGIISIHAPRVGSDRLWLFVPGGALLFQSTLPVWGATSPDLYRRAVWSELFQSTLPVWGATAGDAGSGLPVRISIHAPRVGSDPPDDPMIGGSQISIHAPRVGSDSD